MKFLSLLVCFCALRVSASMDKKIIIIGAGPSGVAATTRLIENGFTNIKILEAENRIGGRVHTIKFGDNVVDMGAHMCHGEKNNAVYQLAKDHNLLESLSKGNEFIPLCNSNGTYVSPEVRKKLFDLAFEITEMDDMDHHKGSIGNFFMEKYEKKIKDDKYKDIDPQLIKEFPKIFEYIENSLDGTDSWYHSAAEASNIFENSEGDFMLGWKDKGYVTIFDLLQKKIPASSPNKIEINDYVVLGKKVKRIDYSTKPVKVESEDGDVYEADVVICTVSLGVLKSSHLSLFHPFLPQEKINAIDGLAFGQLGIINIEFEKPFWPQDWAGVMPRWLPDQLKEIHGHPEYQWLQSLYWIHPVNYQPRVLVGWVSGEFVSEMEKLSPETVGRHVMKWMKYFVKDVEFPEIPLRTERSNWLSNPNFSGTYSYHSLKSVALKAKNEELAQPILDTEGNPLILFAGEATDAPHHSTVHGAIESGWREADRLTPFLSKS